MSVHIVGSPNDYGGDDNPAEHGRDTCVYQELQPVRDAFRKWLASNKNDLFNEELDDKARQIESLLEEISDELNTPM